VRWRDEWRFTCRHALMFSASISVRRRPADFYVKLEPLFDPLRAGQGEMALRLLRIDAANQLPAVLLRQLTHSSTVVADSSVKLLFRLFRYAQRAPSRRMVWHQMLTAGGTCAWTGTATSQRREVLDALARIHIVVSDASSRAFLKIRACVRDVRRDRLTRGRETGRESSLTVLRVTR